MMIKFKLLFVIAFTYIATYAQDGSKEYYPIGTTWVQAASHSYSDEDDKTVVKVRGNFLKHTVIGDTIMAGRKYKWVRMTTNYYNPEQGDITVGGYAIREVGDSIYGTTGSDIKYPGEYWIANERLQYVFNKWEIGDRINYTRNDRIKAIEHLTLADGNTYDCVFYEKPDRYYNPAMVIHSIGSTTQELFRPNSQGRSSFTMALVCFTRNDVLIYKDDRLYELYLPTITTSINEKRTTAKDCKTYTLSGMQVRESGTMAKGIYVRDGKKFVVK